VAAAAPRLAADPLFERLTAEARASAGRAHDETRAKLPGFLEDLGYDGYRGIAYRPEQALWHDAGGRFEIQFFHPGYLYREPVEIHAVEGGRERLIEFSPALFDYGRHRFPQAVPEHLFFAGLRVHYPLHEPSRRDEVAVFLGSSYFRLLGAHQGFGSSLRGLAIDTGEASGEEFPRFTQFWLVKPGGLAQEMRILARLESPRVAAAYSFRIQPGETTVVDVEARLFLRDEVAKLGIAPLTGMFLFAENRTRCFDDFRPEVHDADGLLVQAADGSWQWRPLVNPPKVHRITSFPGATGFGLLQRDRNADHYQDLEARFESRPSYWVEPLEGFGAGRVELVEIPTLEERNDNVVAFWVPERKLEPRQELRFRYRLYALREDPERPPPSLLRVQATRSAPGDGGRTRFVIDFAGGTLAAHDPPLVATVEATGARVSGVVTQRNEPLDGWRTFFDVIPDGGRPLEVRALLRQSGRAVSETWVWHGVEP
jgi:glucans biosynthesis protein